MDSNDCDHALKVVVVGDSGSGKSCLLKQFAKQTYDEMYVSTIGVDFETRKLEISDKTLKLYLWDTAGQERFRNITRSYYRGANAVVVVFDVTDLSSFQSVKRWIKDVRNLCEEGIIVVMAANKVDLQEQRVVSFEDAQTLSEELELAQMYETSAKSGVNVEDLFQEIAKLYYEKVCKEVVDSCSPVRDAPSLQLSPSSDHHHQSNKSCC